MTTLILERNWLHPADLDGFEPETDVRFDLRADPGDDHWHGEESLCVGEAR